MIRADDVPAVFQEVAKLLAVYSERARLFFPAVNRRGAAGLVA
jgi:hypothetical protein